MWELLIQYLAVVGVVLNLFMVYVAVAYSHPHFGQFKWALAVYSTLSACSSFILFLSIPIETVVQSSFVIFSYGGLVASSLGPCLFLLITQLWLVSVIVLFLWRYIALCRGLWAVRIKHRPKYRFCLVSLLSSQLVLSLSCSFIMTRDDELSSVEERQLASQLEDYTPRGYIVYRLTTIAGCLGILYHLALLFTFLITVVVFGRRVWNRIGQLRRGFASFEAKINQQILTALVIQAR